MFKPIKVSSTPLNSPGFTRSFTGPKHISPTFCHSASPGDPIPTPGIFIIAARNAEWPSASAGTAPPIAAKAAVLAAPLSIVLLVNPFRTM